jgi:hypothetical protein
MRMGKTIYVEVYLQNLQKPNLIIQFKKFSTSLVTHIRRDQ